MSRGLFVQGGLCLSGGLCPREGLCPGGSLSGGLCPQGSLSKGSLYPEGLCPGGLYLRVSVQGGLPIPLYGKEHPRYSKERAVLQCILVLSISLQISTKIQLNCVMN